MQKIKVLVIGGGAAGLMAAIAAAQNNAEVTIIEKLPRVGKKLLATGNGRCNLTNIHCDISRYHGTNVRFILGALGQFSVEQTIDFFEYVGIHCKVEEGKVFPASDQASSVLDVLRYELEQLGVKELCGSAVKEIKSLQQGFQLTLDNDSRIKGDKVILATGGKAGPAFGADGSGYELLKPFGHKTVAVFPALVQLKLKANFLKQLKGVKFVGEAAVGSDDEVHRVEAGEILFTDYGISGPPVLQLSRTAGDLLIKNKNPWIQIDQFPHKEKNELIELLSLRLAYQVNKPLDFNFVGLINKKMIPVILKEAGIKNITKSSGEVSAKEIEGIVNILKQWKINILEPNTWKHAQVTAGGIDVEDIVSSTMESKLVPGLFITGEVMDIDGDCGGFNLQWAWSSGYVAGENASR